MTPAFGENIEREEETTLRLLRLAFEIRLSPFDGTGHEA